MLYVAGGISIALTLLQQLLTARFLGAADYGRLAAAVGAVLLCMLLVDARTWELGTRLLARPLGEGDDAEVARTYTWLVGAELLLGVAGMLIVFAAAPVVAPLMLDSESTMLVAVAGLLIPMRQVAMGVSVSLLRLLDRYKWLSARSIGTAVVRLVAIAGPASAGAGPLGVVVGVVVAETIAAISILVLATAACRSRTGRSVLDVRRPRCFTHAKQLAWHLWLSASIKGLHTESFVPITAVFTTSAHVGSLRTALDVASVVVHATTPIAMVVGPRIVQLAQMRDVARLRGYVSVVRRLLLAILVPTTLVAVLFAVFLLPGMLEGSFPHVVEISVLTLFATAVATQSLWVRHVLVGLDMVPAQNKLGLVLGSMSLAALPYVASKWGSVGAAFNLATFLVVYALLSMAMASRSMSESEAEHAGRSCIR